MGPRLRRFALTVHIIASVGWLGAVLPYIVLDVVAATSRDPATLRAAYLAMHLVAAYAIVPLAIAAVVTGLIMSLGTKWGLLRHYWVVVSLVLTLLATVVLFIEMRVIRFYADVAGDSGSSGADIVALGNTLFHSVGGTLVLLVVLVLNVYKPRGLTRYGWRKQEQERARATP